MTRALFVSHTAEKGGAELFLTDVLKGAPAGWQAAFLQGGPVADDLASMGRLAFVIQGSEELLQVKRGGGGTRPTALWGLFRTAVALARRVHKYDVLCPNSQKALFVCAIAAFLARKPLVWILHDILTDEAFSPVNRRAAVVVANTRARRVVVNSRAAANGFVAAGGDGKRVCVVFNGFDVRSWQTASPPAGQRLRAALGFSHLPIVGLFGRLTPWKGQHVLLEALTRLPDVQAVFVGAPLFGEDAYEVALKAQAREMGLESRVRFLGFRSDVAELMSGVDILVHASTHPEPFGRVIVEGQLTGIPVIATAAGGVLEFVEDGVTGVLTPVSSPEQLAVAIAGLLQDPERAARLAAAGRISAAARFDIASTIANLEAALK